MFNQVNYFLIKFPLNFAAAFGGNFGMFQMRFDKINDSLHDSLLNEQEFTYGTHLRISNTIVNKITFDLCGKYQIVATKIPMKFLFIEAGISVMFNSPQWLIDFLE